MPNTLAMKRSLIVILTFFLCFQHSFALNHYYHAVNYNEGLSHLDVKSIFQDSYGFMWFGTKNKLNRFDGVTMRTFDCYDVKKEKRNNNINAIIEDSNRNLWLGTDNGVFIFDPIKESFHFLDAVTKEGITATQWVSDIKKDDSGNIWIVVPHQGVFIYEIESGLLRLDKVVDTFQMGVNNPESITIDAKGKVWIGSNGSGAYLYDESTKSFKQFLGDNGNESLNNKNIYSIDYYNNFLIAGIHEESLMILDTEQNKVQTIKIPQIDNTIIRHVAVYDSTLWIATQNGAYSIEMEGGKVDMETLSTYVLSDKYIESIYKDSEGGIWIGSRFGGVNLLPNHGNIFESYIPKAQNLENTSNRLKEIVEDDHGNLWIGTEDAGLLKFNPKNNTFSNMQTQKEHKQVLALLYQNSNLWVGHFKGGLDIVSALNNSVKHYSTISLGMNEESLFALEEDSHGNIWAGNGWGVYILEKGTFKFKRMDIFGTTFTHDILEDSEGYIWVVTMGTGIYMYNPKENYLKHFTTNSGEGLSTNSVSSVSEDHKGQLWFSTDRGGICRYNKAENSFKSYSIAEGLPDDITYQILEDKNHDLWFGTNNGLVRFNPNNQEIKVYTERDGLPTNRFNYKSGIISKSGKLYMGTMEGLVAFEPHRFKRNMFIPSVHIVQLSVFDRPVTPTSKDIAIDKSIQHTEKVELAHNQSNISISFASLSYTSPTSNNYAYRMEGVDKNWIFTKDSHKASYSNLLPGEYIFRVKGTNNDGVWADGQQTLTIVILPPWWKSTLAYLAYFILAAILFYLGTRFWLRKYKEKNFEKQRLFEISKEKELYEAKINFFTDIAHEIRTPVTLINGPLESIMGEKIEDKRISYNLNIIQKNTKHLLSLINQLLDFRKMDSDKFSINMKRVNIIELVDNTIARFEETIIANKINWTIDKGGREHIFANVDKEAMSKILSNLLSNAVKYTSNSIDFSLKTSDDYLTIRVSNDGELISKEYKDKIFDPFFRVKGSESDTSGSGLGLSLARSLAEVQNGHLYYDSVGGKNNFYLKLPLNSSENVASVSYDTKNKHQEFVEREEKDTSSVIDSLLNQTSHKKKILIVEDNLDMLEFIANELELYYNVETAKDGNEAIDILNKKQIDIVISDVMMPNKNGFELCKHIKEDSQLTDTIVILLTAKDDLDSQIHGLEIGADAYVKKPFSIRYIVTLIATLDKNRQKTIDNYMEKPFLPMQQPGLNKSDTQFLEKIVEAVNENIADSGFNVERLADLMHLSRSSLHRRIKSTIDSTPTDFIRLIRLQKATALIQDGEYRINEIGYLIGINSPSYFIKLFQSQYGTTPKEYEESLKKS